MTAPAGTVAEASPDLAGGAAVVISPWLPTPANPYAGSFVRDFADYAADLYPGGMVLAHMDDAFLSSTPALAALAATGLVRRSVERLGSRSNRPSIHCPVPVAGGSDWLARAHQAHRVGRGLSSLPLRLRKMGNDGRVDVHAHVGLVAGSAGLRAGGARLFVHEHASFLVPLLRESTGVVEHYGRIIGSAAGVFCVNPRMARSLAEIYPQHADRISTLGNAVQFDRFQFRERGADLARWLFLGNLKPAKGTRRLLAAFQQAAAEYPEVTLTVAGSGPDLAWLRAASPGDRLRLVPPVAPAQVPRLMRDHDLLVHLSEGETFGLTAIEAVAAGMPVLLTSTDGSEFVMRPVIELAGAIVPQEGVENSVMAAYRELRADPDRLDLSTARRRLAERFSPEVMRSKLRTLTSQR